MGAWGKDGDLSVLPHLSTVETVSINLLGLAPAFLSHGFAVEFDAISIVYQAIENAVSELGIADLLVQWASGNCEVRIIDRR